MEYINVILGVLAATSIIALAWLGGYELGQANGISAERDLADRRIAGLLAQENKRKPRAARRKVK
jgi:hypothetical protein